MGLDLDLLPAEPSVGDWVAFTRLALERDSATFNAIAEMEARPVSADSFASFCGADGQWAEVATDPYGGPLTWVRAADLAAVPLPDNAGTATRAAWAYLAALPPDAPIVLWWH